MFVRVKKVKGQRYAYLVEGRREGAKVRQRVVCYLGPLSRIAFGVSPQSNVSKPIDWERVNRDINRIPLTFGELSTARRFAYPAVLNGRRQGFLTRGKRSRTEGEEEALANLAASNFTRRFVEVGRDRYRMK